MIEVYDSHEQSERVKGWLRENGGAIVLGLVLAFGGLFGFKQWQLWVQSQHRQASAEYDVMVQLLGAGNLDAAVANYETLRTEFGDSAYVGMAALHMARARLEAGQKDLAAQLLEQAMRNGRPQPVTIVARVRLARLKVDQGDEDGALELIRSAPQATGFEAAFAEIEGDIHKARNEPGLALEAYRQALAALEEGAGNRLLLEMKIESLAGIAGATDDAT
ncbi:MAG: tetratricopeptide repeat protein [Xanthomonadales bacterium]|nr:tetratricopeptide repeat protein [Xanthomonadales bacterium]NIN59450.1 tetratricopeptide repeat protein [Xanthomonadales bacterium]NIN74824.1 tetratricopeptide repeat protein [Xanthomonadales bacterium]NIO12651.1 tetratricopeptide repeat protein [Xanthomonadales bacterium]NIP11843.1 tetratricopeptide repeat protein [Xanthomonadales bacterium]